MKIVILGPAFPYRGGIAAFNERLAREFIAEGHQVTLVTFTLQYPGFLFPGKTQFAPGPPPEGLAIERLINSINPITWIKAGRYVKRQRPDLVIARFWLPFMGPALGTVCRIVRKNNFSRVIALADNIVPHEHKPGDRLLTSYFIGSCHSMVVMSESVLDDLNNFDTRKPRKCGYHPVYDHYGELGPRETALQALNLDPACRYLLFFGIIRSYKGLDLAIEALRLMKYHEKPVKLIVAGEFYSNEEQYRQLVKSMGLEEKVLFYDRYILDEQVRHFFNAADMVVQPYRSATQSGVTQIAYHFNKPMLVTKVGGLAEIVPHGRAGYVCLPDPLEIAAAIDDFYQNKRLDEFVQQVREEKKRFSWGNFTKLFYELMNTGNHD